MTARSTAGGLAIGEIDIISDNFNRCAFVSVLVLIAARLDGTLKRDHLPFYKVSHNKFGCLSPGDYIDKISLPLSIFGIKVPVDGQSETTSLKRRSASGAAPGLR